MYKVINVYIDDELVYSYEQEFDDGIDEDEMFYQAANEVMSSIDIEIE